MPVWSSRRTLDHNSARCLPSLDRDSIERLGEASIRTRAERVAVSLVQGHQQSAYALAHPLDRSLEVCIVYAERVIIAILAADGHGSSSALGGQHRKAGDWVQFPHGGAPVARISGRSVRGLTSMLHVEERPASEAHAFSDQ